MASILVTVKAFVLFTGPRDIEQAAEIIVAQLKRGRVSSKWDHIPMHYNQLDARTLRTTIGGRGNKEAGEEVTNKDILLMNNSTEIMASIYNGNNWDTHLMEV